MRTIYVLVGAPCAGKTRYAQRALSQNSRLTRVNRDDFRYMLRNEGMCASDLEKAITKMQDETVDKLLALEYDVMIDNTHCKAAYIRSLTEKYKSRAYLHIVVLEEPKVKLKFRNILRYMKTGKWIPPSVIDRMHKGVKEVKDHLKNQ